QVLTSDGWFKTGDIGKWVHKRFLKITDRRKDIFKTSSGRFVAPQPIEILLNSSQFIESSMIYGFNRPFVVALILPDFEGLEQWCFANRVHWTAPEYMILNPKVLKLYNALIEQVNTELQNHEKIKKFLLISDKWTPELGQLTPTMKIRRNVIEDTYQAELDSLYD
nr:long-chain fatty acid--CoA ligase [Saprospiraceae bacterium]